jgi:PD-(D/E)XK nuclease family transposase
MIPGIDPRVDYAFKRVFGTEANVPILIDFLHAILDPMPRRRFEHAVSKRHRTRTLSSPPQMGA